MAVPKKKRSLRKRRIRRSSIYKPSMTTNICVHCNAIKKLHYACQECGKYK